MGLERGGVALRPCVPRADFAHEVVSGFAAPSGRGAGPACKGVVAPTSLLRSLAKKAALRQVAVVLCTSSRHGPCWNCPKRQVVPFTLARATIYWRSVLTQ